jgi:hypothetical protein
MMQINFGYGNKLFAILDLENVGVETKIVLLTCIRAEIWQFSAFSLMATEKSQNGG